MRATYEVVEDERERGKVLDSKCAQLTGFIGVILALDATLATSTLAEPLDQPYSTVLPVLYLAAVAALVIGAIAAVVGAVFPQKTLAFDREQFADFADGSIILSDTIPLKQTLIRSYGKAVSVECKRNTRKADALQIASVGLAVGLLAVAGQVATLCARSLNEDHGGQTTHATQKASATSRTQTGHHQEGRR
jgi:hypothetical protein